MLTIKIELLRKEEKIMADINRIISSTVKSGKLFLGSKQAVDAAKSGKAVALVVASNCPTKLLNEIRSYATASKVPVYLHSVTSADLGAVCGKRFSVCVLTVRETGDPDVLRMIHESSEAGGSQGG